MQLQKQKQVPLNGNCKVLNIIYKCTVFVKQTLKEHIYFGIATIIKSSGIIHRQEA